MSRADMIELAAMSERETCRADSHAEDLSCTGGCHCGEVRFHVRVRKHTGTRKCNCSYCSKTRFWKLFVKTGNFRLIKGEGALREYRFGNGLAGQYFCGHCGVNLFMRVDFDSAETCGHVINVACLDDEPRQKISADPVIFEDGGNDNWWVEPAQTGYL